LPTAERIRLENFFVLTTIMGSNGRQLQRRDNKDDEGGSGSCCTWPRIITMVIVLAISGILIWKFAPVDEAIDSILPSYNSTGNFSTIDGTTSNGGDVVITDAPTASPVYQFMQCEDNGEGCCNGLNSNCNLRANEILYATLHNAMATFEDGFIFGPNHQKKLEQAIEVGYRGINLDLCNCGGQTVFW
jgi:hypothetical protein